MKVLVVREATNTPVIGVYCAETVHLLPGSLPVTASMEWWTKRRFWSHQAVKTSSSWALWPCAATQLHTQQTVIHSVCCNTRWHRPALNSSHAFPWLLLKPTSGFVRTSRKIIFISRKESIQYANSSILHKVYLFLTGPATTAKCCLHCNASVLICACTDPNITYWI